MTVRGRAGAGVLADVGERLLHDAVRRERRRRREPSRPEAAAWRVHLGAGRPRLLDQHGDVTRAAAAGRVPVTSPDRSSPRRRRISPSASRPVSAMVARVRVATAGSRSAAYRAPSACTTITDSPWATTSCISRAIRARSSEAASSTCCAASRSTRMLRSTSASTYALRIRPSVPSAQAATTIVGDGQEVRQRVADGDRRVEPAQPVEGRDGSAGDADRDRAEAPARAAPSRHGVQSRPGRRPGPTARCRSSSAWAALATATADEDGDRVASSPVERHELDDDDNSGRASSR